MKVREHQREPLRRDLLLGLILLSLLMAVISFRLIKLPLSVPMAALGFVGVLAFTIPYVLSINPTLIKVVRGSMEEKSRPLWPLPVGLFLLSQLYLAAAGLFTLKLFITAAVYCLLPVLLIAAAKRKSPSFNFYDMLTVFCLWLPIEFGCLSAASLPPQHGLIGLYQLAGLVLLIYFYFIVRELPPAGLTYRLKSKEIQLSIQSCLVFFIAALILGLPTGFISLSHALPGLGVVVGTLLTIAFFIALPEEILFRGVIQNALEQKWAHQANGSNKALAAASLLFGLAHANNHNAPFLDWNLGSLGIWHFPWVYVILATLAGLAYGWVFQKTRKVTAAALTHLLVDGTWALFFNG
ncbi:MAG TPA: CPBP family intramembrane metalloprotease [bacterium]|nr:CPBP family intramembrane metalloprotease [bacterium]